MGKIFARFYNAVFLSNDEKQAKKVGYILLVGFCVVVIIAIVLAQYNNSKEDNFAAVDETTFLEYSPMILGEDSVTTPYVDEFQNYLDDNNIVLTNMDVQYNMENNLDQYFTLIGTAELDDYYNYGYDKSEKYSFCLNVSPKDGDYSNRWYIYCDREIFSDAFSDATKGTISVKMVCRVSKIMFENGQGNMASLEYISWH